MTRLARYLERRRLLRQHRDALTLIGAIAIKAATYTDLHNATGWGSGRIYPALYRLERKGLIAGYRGDDGRRHYRMRVLDATGAEVTITTEESR